MIQQFALPTKMVAVIATALTLVLTTTADAAVATGDPIHFVTTGDFGNTSTGELLRALNSGITFSFDTNNNLRNGVWGRPLRLIARSTEDPSLTYAILNETLALYDFSNTHAN